MSVTTHPLQAFHWTPQPQAEQLLREVVAEFQSRNAAGAEMSQRMTDLTGTRFFDWIDHICLPKVPHLQERLAAAGFIATTLEDGSNCFIHTGGMFPTIRMEDDTHFDLAIRVESVVDFAAANALPLLVAEAPLSLYRRELIARGEGTGFWAVERHGFCGFSPQSWDDAQRLKILRHAEKFRTRRREFEDEAKGFSHTSNLIDHAIDDLGIDVTCDLFFAAERKFWQRRNRAAQVQKSRQDRLGLGWANHDHHTYRSSRQHFSRLVAIFEKLGLQCRERFYAGAQAGWGAQVMENPRARIVVFADVDLSPDELMNDFAHTPLPPRKQLGTVGLWCGLHGEAMLQAGMHHLECQFDFETLRAQLKSDANITTMPPFTNFPFLRQAFTEGERWPVAGPRIDALLQQGQITPEQATQFREQGAIGSHLENLERNEGFKGFNQEGVSHIIAQTDPRKHVS